VNDKTDQALKSVAETEAEKSLTGQVEPDAPAQKSSGVAKSSAIFGGMTLLSRLAGFARDLATLISQTGGAALLIDYGRARPEAGDTLQALKRHTKVHPLEEPGEADLTQWADYPLVLEAAVRSGADVTGCITQAEFLGRLGIEHRAAALAAAHPEAEPIIRRQFERLTSYDQMGQLFKVAAIFSPRSLIVPGFDA